MECYFQIFEHEDRLLVVFRAIDWTNLLEFLPQFLNKVENTALSALSVKMTLRKCVDFKPSRAVGSTSVHGCA